MTTTEPSPTHHVVTTHGRALPAAPVSPAVVQVVGLGPGKGEDPTEVAVLVTFPDGRQAVAWGPCPYVPNNIQSALAASVAVWDRVRAGALFLNAPSL